MFPSIRKPLLALTASLALFGAVEARAASVALVPADSNITVADEIVMRLEASGVSDLKGFQIELSFDSSVLQALSAAGGALLPPGAAGSFFQSFLDNAPAVGRVQLDAAVLTGSASGAGVLGTVRFRAIAIGTSPVTVALVDFRDSANVSSTPSSTGSTIRVFGPVSATRSSWTRLKSLYR
ncbi:MAG: Cohesin domain [Candidatus Eisenbacteria bacterium]|jgi:hypothetical protein